MARDDEIMSDARVYQAHLSFSEKLFADEIDKRIFLLTFLHRMAEEGNRILAFVLLDDELYLVFLCGSEQKRCSAKRIGERLDRIARKEISVNLDKHIYEGETQCLRIKIPEDIPVHCRDLHVLPVKRKCVNTPEDYWWSSYQNYRETYYWEAVDTAPALRILGSDSEKAISIFRKMHKMRK